MNRAPSPKRNPVFQHRSSTRHFLLNQSDTSSDALLSDQLAQTVLARVSAAFSVPSEDRFIDSAMEQLNSKSVFEAMVIQIDPTEAHRRMDASLDPWLDLAELVDHMCKHPSRMWGMTRECIFGVFSLDGNQGEWENLAGRIRERFAEKRKETLSMGIATYPTLKFKKRDVLENALKALNHAAFFGPGSSASFDAVTLNISGDRYFQRGEIQEAIREFLNGLLLDASNVNLHNSLGVCYGVLEQYQDAMDQFSQAIKLDPNEAIAMYNFGLVKRILEDREKALDYFIRAHAAAGDIVEASFEIGKLLLEQGQAEEGLEYFKKAARLRPAAGSIFRFIAECHQHIGSTKEAVFAYKKAIKLNPNDAQALSALGFIYETEGMNLEIAALFCRQSVDIEPRNGLFLHRLGRVCLKENRLDEALAAFRKAADLGHDSARCIEKIRALKQDTTSHPAVAFCPDGGYD